MKYFTIILALAGVILTSNAKATLCFDETTPFTHYDHPDNPSSQEIADALGIPVEDLGSLLYKAEIPSLSEEGSLQTSYATTLNNNDFPITISYVGGTVADATYMVVKDGNQGGSRIYDLSGWNGTDTLCINNVFFPDKTDISGTSHVEFFGTSVAPVPEPSSLIAGALLLAPFGVSTIRVLRKKRTE